EDKVMAGAGSVVGNVGDRIVKNRSALRETGERTADASGSRDQAQLRAVGGRASSRQHQVTATNAGGPGNIHPIIEGAGGVAIEIRLEVGSRRERQCSCIKYS